VADSDLLASVVVAVRGDHRTRRLLASLALQSVAPEQYEVIVVENGSDALADVDTGDGRVRYLHASDANMAAARNVGLAASRGRYLLLADADCVASADWIEKLTGRLAVGDLAAVGGTIGKYAPATWVQRHAITVVDGQRRLSYLPALHLPYVAGANAGFVTELLRAVGGFDEELRSGNDVDVCYRLGLRGHRVGLAPDALILHEDRADLASHFRRFRGYAVYQVLLYAKYRHVTGKKLVIDGYPFRRAAAALLSAPRVVAGAVRGDSSHAARGALQIVEAAGVLVGEIEGAIRFRQVYL
jgi:GT2 family glycosyltransferase